MQKLLVIVVFGCMLVPPTLCSPFNIPYRLPTSDEILNHTPIRVSNEQISDVDTGIEKRVLEYLVEKNYFLQRKLDTWLTLRSLAVLTPEQATTMISIKKSEKKAIKNFQRDNGLPVTGIIDSGILNIVFGTICGTPDFEDEDEEKKR